MSRSKVMLMLLVVGLVSMLISLAVALAQGADGTVTIRDSDDTDYSAFLSDMALINLALRDLPADQVYEGWFVSDDGSREESAGIFDVDANGMVDQTFWVKKVVSSMVVALNEENNSGQSGTATLTAIGGDTEVVLNISAGTMETTLVHIYDGPCGNDTLGGVVHTLTSFVGGSGESRTLLQGVSLASLLTGGLAINSHNSQNAGIYTTCGDIPGAGPSGENLFADFDKFVITIEPVQDDDPGPSADVAAIHQIPKGGILHIRHLLYSWQGNPPYGAGNFHAGTPKGITVGLREQTWVALVHARLSIDSQDQAGVRLHACHVVNIIEGTEGANFDASCGNPGDGFGVLNYAADSALHAGLSASAAANDPVITGHAKEVTDSSKQVAVWATDARDKALEAMAEENLTNARFIIGNVEARLVRSLDGFDADDDGTIERIKGEGGAKQAYWAAQDMGMFTFTTQAPVTVRPPKTGDSSVPTLALAALVIGGLLLLGGAYAYRRSRQRA